VLARFVTEEGHASVLLSGGRWQGLCRSLRWPARIPLARPDGTEKIATTAPGACAASNRHKNLLFSQLAICLYFTQAIYFATRHKNLLFSQLAIYIFY
jgi:hypothetical protein